MFGKALRELRKKNNLSQKKLAEAIDVAPSTISMYEKGKRNPNEELLKTIATYFNVSTDYLLGHIRTNENSNDELNVYLEQLRKNDEMKMLFKLASNATEDDLKAAITFLEMMKNK